MADVAILVPVLGRPHRVKPLLASIADTTTVPYRVLFLVSPSDAIEVQAIQQAEGELWAAKGGYAAKIREGVAVTDEPFLFFAADDLEFRPQWYERAKALIDRGAEVVGVNDLIRRKRRHSTHFLVTREYAERTTIDGEPGPMSDAYFHWFVDDEFIATAHHRGVYAYAEDSVVRHLHPMAGNATDDATYRKGRENARGDRNTFYEREKLWKQPFS